MFAEHPPMMVTNVCLCIQAGSWEAQGASDYSQLTRHALIPLGDTFASAASGQSLIFVQNKIQTLTCQLVACLFWMWGTLKPLSNPDLLKW